ncbi:hypothetical protein AcV5_007372 [Taiwanofungus camphoratus]|nr:hypothetical protein AcV5_007372 [Antrodia cinnamomea]
MFGVLRITPLGPPLRKYANTLTKYCPFTVLTIESSADDTYAAVVTSECQILSNVVVRQDFYHESYGGIHPYVAIEAHQRNMPATVWRALTEAKVSVDDVDGIAFTRGPVGYARTSRNH